MLQGVNTRLGEMEHSLTAQLAVVEDEARAAVEAGLQQQLATVQAALEAGNRVSLSYYHHQIIIILIILTIGLNIYIYMLLRLGLGWLG